MNFTTCRLTAATFVFSLLAQPAALAAGGTRTEAFDAPDRHGNAHVTILQTTDLHDHANGADHVGLDVDPLTGRGGTGAYARIAAYVNHVRHSTEHPVVLVDSGDWTMGTLYDLTLGKTPLALYFLKYLHYDCVTLGNHEFDYTPKGLAQILGAARTAFGFHTPIVASNMDLGGNSDLAPFFGDDKLIQTTRVEELDNGIRVGYIGVMGHNAAQDAPSSAPVRFADPATHYAAIQALVNGLRNDERVQLVIVLSHSGTDSSGTSGEDVELARHVSGINVIASGHTHTPLAAAHTVSNAGWNTQVIDAGAYGTNVFRIDLTYQAVTGTTTVDAAANVAMTDASLAAIDADLVPDPLIASLVRLTDQQLNATLGPFFRQAFPDYDPARIGTGIYHPVGVTAQNMVSNGANPVPSPDGLGDLVADGVRSVPNAILAQTLAAVGGNPANFPGFDFTPFQVGAVATGVLRSALKAGVPLSFADIYDVLPLGISPDSSQALPVGYPLVSAYLELVDVHKVCALQLVVQTNLAPADYYLNLSGLQYGLKAAESYAYFKSATAAAVLKVTSQKAASGSMVALQALGALSSLPTDSGVSLLAAAAGGNPYAAALVKLNDASPSGANFVALGQVAAAAAADRAAGTNTLSALVVSKAVAAIDTLAGFAATDGANIGSATPLPASARVRVAVDLYAVLLLGAVQAQFGVAITPYQSATGPAVLSGANLPGLLANRIDAAPATGDIQELKEWMALLSYVGTGLGGSITGEYASTANFTQVPGFGAAVRTRNASYPIASIEELMATLGGLQAAP